LNTCPNAWLTFRVRDFSAYGCLRHDDIGEANTDKKLCEFKEWFAFHKQCFLIIIESCCE
jgi:hypothetical protein